MGIIRRQGINSSILIYLGFALGAFNILYLFREYLTLEQAGLIFTFVSLGKIILSFGTLGTVPIMNKFFPYYSDYTPPRKNDFLYVSTFLPLIGFIVTIFFWMLFKDIIIRKTLEKSPLIAEYYYVVLVFSGFLIAYTILETYSATRLLTVVPAFLREIGVRIITTLLVLLFALDAFSFSKFITWYSLMYALLALMLFFYLKQKNEVVWHPKLSKVTLRLKGKMGAYGSYIYGGLLISAIAENADTFIIGSLAGLGSVTVYQTGSFVATIIQVPYRSLSAISAPIISQAWKDKDIKLIEVIYKKTALTQLIASVFLFSVIWINIDVLLSFLGENFEGVKDVILILGVARIVDLGFGQNSEILHNSTYWRFNFISYVILVLLFLPLNYFLVKSMGITGSAWSNLLSFLLFNIVRFAFMWKVLKLQPFTFKTLQALAICIGSITVALLVGNLHNMWLNTAVRTLVFSVLFLSMIVGLRISEDINHFANQLKGRFIK